MDIAYRNKDGYALSILEGYYSQNLEIISDANTIINEIKNGNLYVASNMIRSGEISLDYVDEYGWTALHWASYKGYTEVVRDLVNYGADLEAKTRDTFDEREPLKGKTAKDLAEMYQYKDIEALIKSKITELTICKIINTSSEMAENAKDFNEAFSGLNDALKAKK
jgi:ankyrin repeat protein